MPSSVGPNTKGQENLVFGYDLGDTKNSFRGEPTTNSAVVDMTAFTSDNGCTITPTGELLQGQPVYRVYFPSGTLPRIRFNFAYTSGQTWNGSIYYKVVQSGDSMPGFYFRESGFGSSYTSTNFNTDGTWRRANLNYTFSSSGTSMFLLYRANSSTTQPVYIDFAMPQVELNSHATQFTAGTRSATQGLIDLTGNSTIDLTNVSFDSNAQMTFDGTDDYAFTSATDFGTPTDISFECIIRFNGTLDTNDRKVFHIDKTGSTNAVFQLRKGSTNRNLLYQVHDGSSWTTMTDSDAIYSDTWAHFAVTHQGTSAVMYKNGVQTTTATMGQLDWTDVNNLIIGHRVNAEYWKGDIAILKVYSRALTASEIKANYNAIKGRFNI